MCCINSIGLRTRKKKQEKGTIGHLELEWSDKAAGYGHGNTYKRMPADARIAATSREGIRGKRKDRRK